MKPVSERDEARRDIESAFLYSVEEHGETVALCLIDELERAYTHIGRHPGTGSPRYAHELNLPGLRFWPLSRYPLLIFYVERPHDVDVWRVLHAQRDVAAWMQKPEAG